MDGEGPTTTTYSKNTAISRNKSLI
jgi:hypothetical protein